MRAPGWGHLPAGCVLGVLALGALGLPALGPPAAGGGDPPAATAVERRTTQPVTMTAADVVLPVRAVGTSSAQVALPGTVEGAVGGAAAAPAAAEAASVVPPGLTGPPGTAGPLGVPDRVLAAYRSAETRLASSRPGCAMPWWLLAGIGKIESGHAGGGRVDGRGRTRGEVLGPLLDGSLAGTMVVPDTDGGAMDGSTAFDRAVGPMQFLPGTWDMVGTDADRDGTADPHDVDDAATTAGVYLCRGGGSMLDPEQLRAAVLRYNGSTEYVDAVLAWGTSYRDRAVGVPGQAGTIPPPRTAPTAAPTAAPTVPPSAPTVPSSAPTRTPRVPAPTTSRPVPTSSPTTGPTPSPGPTATPTPPPAPTTAPAPAPPPGPGPEPTAPAPAP